jgi:peroxiredoxin
LRDHYPRIRAQDVEVLALAPATLAEAAAYAASHPIPFPLLADPSLTVYRSYQVDAPLISLGQRPALYAIDQHGIVRYAHIGFQQWQLGSTDEAIESLIRPREASTR